jgi:hypothetical protein
VICALKEESLHLKYNESGLRRIIEDKDRLLQAKETEYVAEFDRQNKMIEHLLTQLIDVDRIKEETLGKLAAAKVKPDTRDVGCGSDEPLVSTDFDPTVVTACSPSEPDEKEEVPVHKDSDEEEEDPPCTTTEDQQQSTENAEEESGEEEDLFFEPDWYLVDKYMYERGWRLEGMVYPGNDKQPPVKVMQPPLVRPVLADQKTIKIQSPSEIGSKFYPADSSPLDITSAVMEDLLPSSPQLQQTSQPLQASSEIGMKPCPADSSSFDVTSIVMQDFFPETEKTSQPKEASSPTKTATPLEYYIMSDIMKTVRNKDIVVNGISTSDYGRVVGKQGKNMERLETEYGVSMSLNAGKLVISGGDAEKRRDAAQDVIDNLPVVIECPKLPLGDQSRITNQMIRYYNYEYEVRITRPSASNQNGTIWGRLDKCRIVYELLKKHV